MSGEATGFTGRGHSDPFLSYLLAAAIKLLLNMKNHRPGNEVDGIAILDVPV